MQTHVFTLPSGVECEVKDLTGKHQRILTEQKNKKLGENLNEVLADCIVRVGEEKNITLEFIEKMLAADRKKALVEIRQFTFDYEPVFKFKYEYLSGENGNEQKKEQEMEIALSKQETDEEGQTKTVIKGFPTKPYYKQWKEYKDIEKEVIITLKKSGKEVVYRMLDGQGEQVGMMTKKAERSTHTALRMRFPREFVTTSSGKTPIQLDLDKLPLKDIEQLRASIKEHEGQVDTEFRFMHPEAELKDSSEKEVIVDILSVLAFFFPSEAI